MKKLFILVFISHAIVSCVQNQKKVDDAEARTQAVARNSFFHSLRDPQEIASELVPGIGFDAGILNDPARFIDYTGNDVKAAANLGIYLSDLNYCVLNKQSSKTKEYFNAAYELSKVLLAEKRTLEFLMKRYEENINQNDSVKEVMGELFTSSTLGLEGTERERLAGISMAAYQIENVHIALSTIHSFPDSLNDDQIHTRDHLLQFIAGEQQKFEIIHSFLRANSDPLDPDRNPNYPFYDNAILELIAVYKSATSNDPKTNELSEKISIIRSKMVMIE